jgi:hypothetical protein
MKRCLLVRVLAGWAYSNRGQRKLAFYRLQTFYKKLAEAGKENSLPRVRGRDAGGTKSALRAVLDFLVPGHLDGFQLTFV